MLQRFHRGSCVRVSKSKALYTTRSTFCEVLVGAINLDKIVLADGTEAKAVRGRPGATPPPDDLRRERGEARKKVLVSAKVDG